MTNARDGPPTPSPSACSRSWTRRRPAVVVLAPGDVVVVASDGLFEARNRGGEWFGTDRVVALVRERHAARGAEILGALRDAVARFTEGTGADDDRTAIVIKRHG